jgi:hypothetical protein
VSGVDYRLSRIPSAPARKLLDQFRDKMRALHYALATEKAYLAARRDRTPPTTPANFRVTEVSPTSVSIAWNASSDNSGSFVYVLSTNTVTVTTLQPDPNDHTPPSTPANLSENDFGDGEFWPAA